MTLAAHSIVDQDPIPRDMTGAALPGDTNDPQRRQL
jgi:hypothetical protein